MEGYGDVEKILVEFYNGYNEEERLLSPHGKVEFIVTTHYINRYLSPGKRILEIGCGTGRYALHYAHLGYEVDGVELVPENLAVLKENILPGDVIRPIQGNALDLSVYQDNTFDCTLLLGPMYHLFTQQDKEQCLKEAVRVTKKNGIIFVAYCQFDASVIQAGFIRNLFGFLVEEKLLDDTKFLPISSPTGIFELYRKEQVDELIKTLPVARLHYVGTDMFTRYCENEIDTMENEMYQKYIEYTFTICENQNLVGLSNHSLDILRKE